MHKRTKHLAQQTLALPETQADLVRYDKNLLLTGFFSAHDPRHTKDAPGESVRRVEAWITENGRRELRAVEFRSGAGTTLPTTVDRDKYMALLKIMQDSTLHGQPISNTIRFSGYQMLKLLGRQADGGSSYEDIKEWGLRMKSTVIRSERVIYLKARKQFTNEALSVFRNFKQVGESDLDGGNATVRFEVMLEDWVVEGANSGYSVVSDFAAYKVLTRPTAKGIMIHLPYWFTASDGRAVEKSYGELCTHLGIPSYKYESKIRETMGKSLDELISIRYLRSWDVSTMGSKEGFKLILEAGTALLDLIFKGRRKLPATKIPLLEGERNEVVDALMARGITSAKAIELNAAHPAASILDLIEYFDHTLAEGGNRIKSPTGFLIRLIESGEPVPANFETTARRKAREEARAKRREVGSESINDMMRREEYETWRLDQAKHSLKDQNLQARLEAIRVEMSKDRDLAQSLARMPVATRQKLLVKQLYKQTAATMKLATFAEWTPEMTLTREHHQVPERPSRT